ncbi:MAG: methyltransferase domain-containing protein [Thermodesulfobacteriota bacterium]
MSDPRPPAPVRPEVYVQAWCDGMGGRGSNEIFVASGGRETRPRLAYALNLADLRPGLKVLDLGCGRGEVAISCALAGAALAAAVDYAPVPLERAAENAAALNQAVNMAGSALVLSRADAKALPFPDQCFDRVFMLDIVEHLHEWELQQVWSEVRRLLAPGGYLVVHTLPNRWAIDYGYRLARLLLRRLPAESPDKRDLFHVNEQSPPQLRRSLVRAGLSCHVWLKDLILDQAGWWRRKGLAGEEAQELVYGRLLRPGWRSIYRLLTSLPTRLFLATDLFALAWPSGPGPAALERLPAGLAEKAASRLGG